MTDFAASLVPIAVPSLTAATAKDIALFQASFATNIVTTGNSLLQNYIALKDKNFFAVGDIPVLGPQMLFIDSDLFATAKTRPAQSNLVDFSGLLTKIDQLAALVAPAVPTLTVPTADLPTLDATAPVITLPVAPSSDVGVAPQNAPNVVDPVTPDAPSIVLPATPTFDELQLPVAPSFYIPAWSAVAPQNLLSPPTNSFSYVDPGYTSPLADALVVKLLNDVQNGTYGIEPADEAALWARARDRAAQQGRAKAEEARRQMSQTSFPVPQSVMFDNIQREEQQIQEKLSETNRDILLKRSELYFEGRKFTLQEVRQYEQVRISLYNATQERALNMSKAQVELGIAVYDATVRNYNAQLEGYKAEAAVFESRIRAELAKAEVYKAQVAAEALRAQFNKAKLELYLGQLQAITTTVELYKARLAAANLFMQVQAQKVDVFRSQVQAYAERVHAKEAEFNIYQAAIKGQLAGLEIYKAQIDAYNARLSGMEAKGRITLQGNTALTEQYKAAVIQYSNQLESFTKQITAKIDEAKTRVGAYQVDVGAYQAFTNAAMKSAEVQLGMNAYNLDWNKESLKARVEQVRFRLDQLAKTIDLEKDVNAKGIDFLRSALGGSISGLNSLGTTSS
jgi:hypothetical protein